MTNTPAKLTKKDFTSDIDVKWCAGCGDYAVLAYVQKMMPELGISKEDFAFISGIGCASRFPIYMDTYGFHTVHGRALSVATGTKMSNPDLSVWVIMGDGDALSIGGNHFIHAIRRNIDVNVILLDNQIYGLTKGQFSPTSEKGKVTKSTPYGSLEDPVDPMKIALAAGVSFVARTTDRDGKAVQDLIKKAHAHKGFSLIHVYQNCVIFNDGTFGDLTGKQKKETTLSLVAGEPMIFGANLDKGIIVDGFQPKVVEITEENRSQLLKHDPSSDMQAQFLSNLKAPDFPVPMGVYRQVERPSYDEAATKQVENVIAKKGKGDLQTLLNSGETWTIN